MGLMYGLYTGSNVEYVFILWAQLIQTTYSVLRHNEISCARFWTIAVNREIKQLKIPIMSNAMMDSIATHHATNIILVDWSLFSFVGSIPEDMFRDVPLSSKILEGYHGLTPSRPLPLSDEFQVILVEVDKAKKGAEGQ